MIFALRSDFAFWIDGQLVNFLNFQYLFIISVWAFIEFFDFSVQIFWKFRVLTNFVNFSYFTSHGLSSSNISCVFFWIANFVLWIWIAGILINTGLTLISFRVTGFFIFCVLNFSVFQCTTYLLLVSDLISSWFFCVLEFFSHFFRILSLSLRIIGNSLAGHVILHIFWFFTGFWNFSLVAYLFITSVECSLSLVQIFVYVTLTNMY